MLVCCLYAFLGLEGVNLYNVRLEALVSKSGTEISQEENKTALGVWTKTVNGPSSLPLYE